MYKIVKTRNNDCCSKSSSFLGHTYPFLDFEGKRYSKTNM
jgi:hypothetical protein